MMFGELDGVHGYLTCCRCRRRACRRRRPKWYMASGRHGVPLMTCHVHYFGRRRRQRRQQK